jgi:hypothetical protein
MARTMIITEADGGKNLYIWDLSASTVDADFRYNALGGAPEFTIQVRGYGKQVVISSDQFADWTQRRTDIIDRLSFPDQVALELDQ